MAPRRVSPLLAALAIVGAGTLPAAATGWAPPPTFGPYEARDVGSWPESVAIGDFTGDGRQDVAMSTSFYFDGENDYRVFLFAQQADGSLGAPLPLDRRGAGNDMSLAAGDLDDDGDTDLALATADGVDLFLQVGGSLKLVPEMINAPGARQVTVADVDANGAADLVVSDMRGVEWYPGPQPSALPARLITTNGNLTELEVGDVTNDGLADLVGFSGKTVFVYIGQPGGTFSEPATRDGSDWASGIALGDLDGDGLTDIALTVGGNRPASAINVFYQTPTTALAPPVVLASYDIPEPVEAADMNGDGAADLVTLHGGWNAAGVYTQGAEGLGAESLWAIPYASHYNRKGLALGDIDGDGKRDIVLADYNHGLVVLHNTGETPPPPADTTPPQTTITSGPAGTVATRVATFAFSSSEAGGFTCSLDGATFSACTSPATYSSLSDGSHTFSVRATDTAGNADPTPAAWQWRIDTTPPDTAITSGPSGTATGTSATFAFTATESGATFTCSLDGATAIGCSSPVSYNNLAYGPHSFSVRATDPLGNGDLTPASRNWTIATPADARIALAATPNPAKTKSNLVYTQVINNDGPGAASGVVTTQSLPAGASFVSSSPSRGTCSLTGTTLTCAVGTLAAGGSATVAVTVKVTAGNGSTLSTTAAVATSSYDPASVNNSATSTVTVGRR